MSFMDFYYVSCKQVIPEDAITCPVCGADQRNPVVRAKDPTSNITLRLTNAHDKLKKRVLDISVAIALVCLIIASVSLHRNNSNGFYPNTESHPSFAPNKNARIPVNPTPHNNENPPFPSPAPAPVSHPFPSNNGGAQQSVNPNPTPNNSIPSDLPIPTPEVGSVKITDASLAFVGDDMSDETVASGRVNISNTTNHDVMSVTIILGDSFGPELVPFEGTVSDPSPIFDTSIPAHTSVSFPVMTTG